MIDPERIRSTPAALAVVALSVVGLYLVLMLCTRPVGLRSFSKIMSSFDFTITAAIGSLVVTVIVSEETPLMQGAVGDALCGSLCGFRRDCHLYPHLSVSSARLEGSCDAPRRHTRNRTWGSFLPA